MLVAAGDWPAAAAAYARLYTLTEEDERYLLPQARALLGAGQGGDAARVVELWLTRSLRRGAARFDDPARLYEARGAWAAAARLRQRGLDEALAALAGGAAVAVSEDFLGHLLEDGLRAGQGVATARTLEAARARFARAYAKSEDDTQAFMIAALDGTLTSRLLNLIFVDALDADAAALLPHLLAAARRAGDGGLAGLANRAQALGLARAHAHPPRRAARRVRARRLAPPAPRAARARAARASRRRSPAGRALRRAPRRARLRHPVRGHRGRAPPGRPRARAPLPGRGVGAARPRGRERRLCRGNFQSTFVASGGYEPVAEILFNEVNIQAYFMEYNSDRAGGFEPLQFVPKNKTVVLGLVTSKFGTLESKDALKRQIDEAAKYIALDQLCLSPQCGFASTEEGNVLADDEQWAKLRTIVEVSNEVWG